MTVDAIKPVVVLASGKRFFILFQNFITCYCRFKRKEKKELIRSLEMFRNYALIIGDLTDAKTKDKMGSMQILEEWQYYKYVIDETNMKEKTLWLDVRGNHGEERFHYVNHCAR